MSLTLKTSSLETLLASELKIPPYQRPYSWKETQLKPLLNDLFNRNDGDLLVMGGVILHKKNHDRFIVDGQQRLITFSIIQYLFHNICNTLMQNEFRHAESIKNITKNSQLIKFYKDKKKIIDLKNIYFIVVETESLDDAFAFFDSQNTRGKSLEDCDVLKAHHLRFISDYALATSCAKAWEEIETSNQKEASGIGLKLLLETYLARGRKWSNNNHNAPLILEEFKSQRKKKPSANNYILNNYQQGAIFKSWNYNQDVDRIQFNLRGNIQHDIQDNQISVRNDDKLFFPFQITQTIEGGELFFWYTEKYHKLSKVLFSESNRETSTEFKDFFRALEKFDYNKGTRFVKSVLHGAILFYVDKFGYQNIDTIASKLFFSIYLLRLKKSAVQYTGIYKFLREEFNPFSLIRKASFPEYIVSNCDDFLEGCFLPPDTKVQGIRAEIIRELSGYHFNVFLKEEEDILRNLKLWIK